MLKLLFFACGVPFYHIMLIKFMKEEGDNKSSLKKSIYYSLGILTPHFSILCPILIQHIPILSALIQKAIKILCKYRIAPT